MLEACAAGMRGDTPVVIVEEFIVRFEIHC